MYRIRRAKERASSARAARFFHRGLEETRNPRGSGLGRESPLAFRYRKENCHEVAVAIRCSRPCELGLDIYDSLASRGTTATLRRFRLLGAGRRERLLRASVIRPLLLPR